VVRRVGCVAGIGCVAVIPSAGRHGKTRCHGRMSFRRLLCRGPHRLDFARRLPGSPWSVIASGARVPRGGACGRRVRRKPGWR
jgi:hypothetical protein